MKLTFTNLLPGTYFALFGTMIIGIMLWKGEPQLNQKDVTETTGHNEKQASVVLRSTTEKNMRIDGCLGADCENDSLDIRQEWDKLKPETSLSEAALPLSRIATVWQKEKRVGEALSLARLAALYGKAENKADHLTLLAELLRVNGDEDEALKTEQAADSLRRQGK
uniref:hypothetical protein n=1 Tax=Candidatus Electronema sp. TaxID=2698783 RepID=UPI0040566689